MNNLVELTNTVMQTISEAIDVPEEKINSDAAMGVTEKWDSLGQLNLILLLEEKFDLVIPDDLVPSLTSLETIVAWLSQG